MKKRKPLVISESTALIACTCQEMVRQAFKDTFVVRDGTALFKDWTNADATKEYGYVELLKVYVSMRVHDQLETETKWVADFCIAKNSEGRWVLAKGWYSAIKSPEKQASHSADYCFFLDKLGRVQLI